MVVKTDNQQSFELQTIDQWKGLNQQGRRGSIDDQELWWDENLFAIGPGNLRSCWGHGPAIYTAPAGTKILRLFFGFIGNETGEFNVPPPGRLGWMFLDNGDVQQVDLDTYAVTDVGNIWEPITPQYWASAVVWRPQYFGNMAGQQGGVLFGSPKGLYAWDGTTLSAPTDPAPDWLTNANENPAQPTFAGAGTGTSTGTTSLAMTGITGTINPGANVFGPGVPAGTTVVAVPPGTPGTSGTFTTNQPTTLTAAPLTFGFTMPVGLPGIYCLEVYQARLFVAGKDVISYSAPANGADFSTSDGGGSFGYFGNKLTYTFNDLAASSGYLYCYGDSSIDLIANVQLSGNGTPQDPFVTNLNYQNIDPQVGQRFPRPVGRIGRYMQMFNGAGIYETRGGEAREIGARVTNIFNTLDTSQFLPTMCPATMFGFKVLLCNGMFTDPWGVQRSLLLMWHPTQNEFWSIASQNLNLTNIGAYEQDSVITPYGTDGTNLYQLFAQPDPSLLKRLSTKFLRGGGLNQLMIKNWKRLFLEVYDNFGGGLDFTGQMHTRGGGIPGGEQDVSFQLSQGQIFDIIPCRIEGAGIAGAIDLQSLSPDFTIERLHIGAENRTLFGA